MIVGLPICQSDFRLAWRLLRWMHALSGDLLKNETLAVVWGENIPREKEQFETEAAAQWGGFHLWLPDKPDERGWPGSPTNMFNALLDKAQLLQESVLLIEPDCVPLDAMWIGRIRDAFKKTRKPFMGDLIPTLPAGIKLGYYKEHMSGIGVYRYDWRDFAPSIAEANSPDAMPLLNNGHAWDLYAAKEIVPNMKVTKLIQHVWRPGKDLAIRPEAVLFHQAKDESFMKAWDRKQFSGKIFGSHFDLVPLLEETYSYYRVPNASRPFKLPTGQTVLFKPTRQLAGTWTGVFRTKDHDMKVYLDLLHGQSRTGVEKISEDEYMQEVRSKK